ncbi:hypothetical protein ABT324_32175, partial [Saccharopolyspora sp. NPDC000359]
SPSASVGMSSCIFRAPGARPDTGGPHDPKGPDGSDPTHPKDFAPDRPDPHRDGDADPGTPERQRQIDEAEAHRDTTPGGSSFHTDPNMRDLAQRVPDDGVHHTVDVHALPDGRVRVGDRTFSPQEFADMLRRDPNWDGKPIRLLSCDAGTSGLARDLSRELGVPVTAPRGLAWTDGSGRVFASDMGPDGRPGWPPNGGWDTHHPDGTRTPASNDGFHPTRDGADPGQHPDDAEARGDEDPHGQDGGFDPPPQRVVLQTFDPADTPDHYGTPGGGRPKVPDPITSWNRPDDATFTRPGGHPEGRSPITVPDPSNPKPLNKLGSRTTLSSLSERGQLAANTRYDVPGRGSFFTDGSGRIKWAEIDTTADGYKNHKNPELRYPAPNAAYRVDNNWTFNTNENGQTERMSGTPHYKDSPGALSDDRYGRDQSSQDRAGDEGRAVYPERHWAGGHMAAHEAGGPGEYINMFPQMAASNSGHNREGMTNEASWRNLEDYLSSAHQRNATIDRIEVHAPRDPDGIPTTVTYRWLETDEHGVTRYVQADFPNRPDPDFHYGPWKDYGEDEE